MANAPSTKRVLIDKTNARVVIYVSVAAFIVVFSLIATKTLISQATYQNRIISAKRQAVSKLKSDVTAANQLKKSYQAFTSTAQNSLGGTSSGTGANDGDNAKIILDALPSGYDFPGLTTSIESLLSAQNVTIASISGTDDEANQSTNQTSPAPTPQSIPFTISITSDYAGVQRVITALEHSIRPISVQTLDISGDTSGSQGGLTLNIAAQTYYQPAKTLNIGHEVVK